MKIASMTTLATQTKKVVSAVSPGHPVVIMFHNRPAVVLVSPDDIDLDIEVVDGECDERGLSNQE